MFFFFQAEGGIRDIGVTGVQTCALPICLQQLEMDSNGKSVRVDGSLVGRATSLITWGGVGTDAQHAVFQLLHQGTHLVPRSEERRVGKECRYRWSPHH